MVYVSYFQRPSRTDALVIRVSGSVSEAARAIRTQLQPSFPTTPLEVRALDDQVQRTLVNEHLMASLTAGSEWLALL